MPLTMARNGEKTTVKRVHGSEKTKRFLNNLGFVAGACVTVVASMGGGMIVEVKDSRVAVNREMAGKIMI